MGRYRNLVRAKVAEPSNEFVLMFFMPEARRTNYLGGLCHFSLEFKADGIIVPPSLKKCNDGKIYFIIFSYSATLAASFLEQSMKLSSLGPR